MAILFFFFFAALLAVATAQTAPGFPITVSQRLSVAYGTNALSPPGINISQADTANPPTNISTPVATDLGLLLMVDKDVPIGATRVQLIHWLVTDIQVAPPQAGSSQRALTLNNAPVPYLAPMPPAGDQPHAYTFLLYPQPANFSLPPQYANLSASVQNRIGFDVVQFVKDAKLAAPLAANYMMVQNTTALTSAVSFPPISTATPAPTSTPTLSDSRVVMPTATTSPVTFAGHASSWPARSRALYPLLPSTLLALVL